MKSSASIASADSSSSIPWAVRISALSHPAISLFRVTSRLAACPPNQSATPGSSRTKTLSRSCPARSFRDFFNMP